MKCKDCTLCYSLHSFGEINTWGFACRALENYTRDKYLFCVSADEAEIMPVDTSILPASDYVLEHYHATVLAEFSPTIGIDWREEWNPLRVAFYAWLLDMECVAGEYLEFFVDLMSASEREIEQRLDDLFMNLHRHRLERAAALQILEERKSDVAIT